MSDSSTDEKIEIWSLRAKRFAKLFRKHRAEIIRNYDSADFAGTSREVCVYYGMHIYRDNIEVKIALQSRVSADGRPAYACIPSIGFKCDKLPDFAFSLPCITLTPREIDKHFNDQLEGWHKAKVMEVQMARQRAMDDVALLMRTGFIRNGC